MFTASLPLALAAAAAPGGANGALAAQMSFFFPLILVMLIFWLLVWRPQGKRMREHQAAILAVKKGDEVVTGGGIRGRVTKAGDDEVEVEIAQGIKVRVVKSTLSQVLTASGKPAND